MVERIEEPEAFEALREEWNELLEASASNCLFLTWEWLHTWWTRLAEGRRLCILAVRCGQELSAIAPLARRTPAPARLLPFPALQFLGTGTVGSDYLDVIARRGREEEAVSALAAYLAREGLTLELGQLKRGSCAAALAARLGQHGWLASDATTNVCPFITLAGHSWPSYLASLGPAHRYNFQRRLRNLQRQYDVRFEAARSEEERRAALALLVRLHNMRWQERGGSEAFQSPALLSFYDEVSRLALTRGWLRLFLLRLDGTSVAALHGYRYHRTFYFYQSGFDPRHAKQSVGLVTMGLAIQHAIEEGAEEYDFLHGDEAYKAHWAREARELGRLEVYPPGRRGLLYRRVTGLSRTSRKAARRLLGDTLADLFTGRRRPGVPSRIFGRAEFGPHEPGAESGK